MTRIPPFRGLVHVRQEVFLGGPKFYDLFTGSDNTNLTSHTPNRGGAWSSVNGAIQIQSNKAQATTVGGIGAVYYTDVGTANYTITANLVAAASSFGGTAIMVRYGTSGGTKFYHVGLERNNNLFVIYRYDGSFTRTQSTAFTVTAGTSYPIRVVVSGNTITATVNGGNQIQETSATNNTSSTLAGLRFDTVGCNADDYMVTAG